MSVQNQARRLAAKGRNGDSLLVHMTPREVAGLEALAQRHYGKGLTINPDTGLPEASILRSILPMVAGIALSATGIGAPMAALMVGGAYGLATKSLEQGLMAGLGAYGGAGLGAGLAGAGTSAAAAAPSAAAQTALGGAESATAAFGDVAGSAAGAVPWEAGFEGSAALGNAASAAPWEAGFQGTAALADAAAPMSGWQQMGQGLQNLGQPGGMNAFMQAQGGGMGLMQNGLMSLAPTMDPNFGSRSKKAPGAPEDDGMIRPYNYNPSNQAFTARAPVRYADFTGFAEGGVAGLMTGPGDGVSDSIPATVNGNEPAALADGEFVIPARIVSELGNGSTDAGARKLYAMMDRVQQHRRNTTKNAGVNSRADMALPA